MLSEVQRIVDALSRDDAAGIRNEVALAAMRRQRPEADADACRDAFFARWGHELLETHREAARSEARNG